MRLNPHETYIKQRLTMLAKPGILAEWIDRQNKLKFVNRVFVMGCGRSGTWLLTGVMNTYQATKVLPYEVDIAYFGLVDCDEDTLVLKRAKRSYEKIESIPLSVAILYIVRHPYDVLTSHNPKSDSVYYIEPGRWLGEMMSLRWLIESKRPKTKIIRYEDLVTLPNETQLEIGEALNLQVERPAIDYCSVFNPAPQDELSMHGLRPPDISSIDRWRKDIDAMNYLSSIQLRLSDCLPWVATTFGYDVELKSRGAAAR
jgi:hypothetical protein